jgi:hypothetical protein
MMTEEIRIAVGIIASEDAQPIVQRWRGKQGIQVR